MVGTNLLSSCLESGELHVLPDASPVPSEAKLPAATNGWGNIGSGHASRSALRY